MSDTDRESRFPDVSVSVRSSNPLALVAGVRHELRRAGAEREDIARFTEEALAAPSDLEHALGVARHWIGSAEAA